MQLKTTWSYLSKKALQVYRRVQDLNFKLKLNQTQDDICLDFSWPSTLSDNGWFSMIAVEFKYSPLITVEFLQLEVISFGISPDFSPDNPRIGLCNFMKNWHVQIESSEYIMSDYTVLSIKAAEFIYSPRQKWQITSFGIPLNFDDARIGSNATMQNRFL